MKEWGFIKHFPENEMAFIVLKFEERRAHATEPRDTVFVRGDITIKQNRIANFRKLRKSDLMSPRLPVDAGMNIPSSFN